MNNPSSSKELEKIKSEITEQLFTNVSSQSQSKADQDKLFCIAEVFEESKPIGVANNYMKNLAKGSVMNVVQKSSLEYKKKYKKRYLCVVGEFFFFFKKKKKKKRKIY